MFRGILLSEKISMGESFTGSRLYSSISLSPRDTNQFETFLLCAVPFSVCDARSVRIALLAPRAKLLPYGLRDPGSRLAQFPSVLSSCLICSVSSSRPGVA